MRPEIPVLTEKARLLRRDVFSMVFECGEGHPGAALSCADLIAALYFHIMRVDPANPDWPQRDRFILSKGHACPSYYSALARRGFFPMDWLPNLRRLGSPLQGHPVMKKTPGVDMTAGLLGHGIPVGIGLSLAARLRNAAYRTYVVLGDGECQAGVVWEGAMAAAKFGLANLTAILDYNDVQLDGPVHEIMPLEPLADKWRSFNWNVLEINGHDMHQVLEALDLAAETHSRPTIIIAHTTKGKGVSYMENRAQWHGAAPNEAQYRQALEELGRID